MRKTAYGTVKVRGIAGTYVVFLALDMKQADATGLMGFAIQRTRLSDGEVIIASKDVAAAWTLDRLPDGAGEALALARAAYLADAVDTWDVVFKTKARADWHAMLDAIGRD